MVFDFVGLGVLLFKLTFFMLSVSFGVVLELGQFQADGRCLD